MDNLTNSIISTPLVFECEYCHDAVDTAHSPPTCCSCGTRYRFIERKNTFTTITSRAQIIDLLSLLFGITGIVLLVETGAYQSSGWFFAFLGFALHYGNGLRNGVLSSRFFLFKCAWTVYRVESPTTFGIAVLVEGILCFFLLLIFLFSL